MNPQHCESTQADVENFMTGVVKRNPHEPEFHQAVHEVTESLMPYLQKLPTDVTARNVLGNNQSSARLFSDMQTRSWILSISLPLLVNACQPVGIADQAQLSRPIYDFDGSGTRSYDCGLSTQIETGRSGSSNVSAGGCASCQ